MRPGRNRCAHEIAQPYWDFVALPSIAVLQFFPSGDSSNFTECEAGRHTGKVIGGYATATATLSWPIEFFAAARGGARKPVERSRDS